MAFDTRDEHERPTLLSPRPLPGPRRDDLAFDGPAERFFLDGEGAFDGAVTLDAPSEEEDIGGWWLDQRRRSLWPIVAATLAVCVCLLAAGVVPR
jgi:hypothetical protein